MDFYQLDLDDARNLFALAVVTEDRSDDEQAALVRLADWLDQAEKPTGETQAVRAVSVTEAGVTSVDSVRPTKRSIAESTRERY